MSQKITKRFFLIYTISGDSGVGGRGTYFLQTDCIEEVDKCCEAVADMNDDRCHAEVVYYSPSIRHLE